MSKSNETTPNVPTLRFKDYVNPWDQKSFNETFDILTNNTLSRAELNYKNGEYKNIHYGDVLIKFSAHIDTSSVDIPYINDKNASKKFDNALLQNGDIVFADTAEDYTVGKATEIENAAEYKVISGLHTIPCHPKMTFSPRYLGYFTNSPKYHNQLIPYIQGVKVSSISKTLIKNTTISYPSLEEQAKIASFLSCLDEKIEVQNKIISKYETLIKGIKEKIANSNWKWIKLDELIKKGVVMLNRGNIIPKHAKSDLYQYPVYSSSTQNNGLMGYNDSYMFDKELITWSIDGGGNFFYRNKHKFNVTNVCGIMQVDESAYLYRFIAAMLTYQHSKMKFDYQSKAHPSVISTLYSFPVVPLAMQSTYCQLLIVTDKIISTEKTYLSKLKEQKNYLLSKMFI